MDHKNGDDKDVGRKMGESKAGLTDQPRWRPPRSDDEDRPFAQRRRRPVRQGAGQGARTRVVVAGGGSRPPTGLRPRAQFSTLRTVFLIRSWQAPTLSLEACFDQSNWKSHQQTGSSSRDSLSPTDLSSTDPDCDDMQFPRGNCPPLINEKRWKNGCQTFSIFRCNLRAASPGGDQSRPGSQRLLASK